MMCYIRRPTATLMMSCHLIPERKYWLVRCAGAAAVFAGRGSSRSSATRRAAAAHQSCTSVTTSCVSNHSRRTLCELATWIISHHHHQHQQYNSSTSEQSALEEQARRGGHDFARISEKLYRGRKRPQAPQHYIIRLLQLCLPHAHIQRERERLQYPHLATTIS